MLRYYASRELSGLLAIPLSRWKRWSREFLPPDPLGGLQSGFARQYSVREAFDVYWGGFLVSCVGFSIPEARQILQDLREWMQKEIVETFGGAAAGQIDLVITPADDGPRPSFFYRIRRLVDRFSIAEGDVLLWQEKFEERSIREAEIDHTGSYPACSRWVDVSAVAEMFWRRLNA